MNYSSSNNKMLKRLGSVTEQSKSNAFLPECQIKEIFFENS